MRNQWVRYRTRHSYGNGKWMLEPLPDIVLDVDEFVHDIIPMSEHDGEHYRGFEFVVIDESELTKDELIGLVDYYTEAIRHALRRVAYCTGERSKVSYLLSQKQQEGENDTAV